MKNRAQGVARGSALIVTGVAALVLGIGSPAFADNPHGDPSTGHSSDPDSNGDVNSNCHTGSKGLGAGGEDKSSNDCQTVTPQPPPQPGTPPVQPGTPAAQVVAGQQAVPPGAPAQVAATVPGPIPTAVEAGQHTTDSWTVPLGAALVTLGAAGSGAALVARRRTAQR